jgi:hypothetical protein
MAAIANWVNDGGSNPCFSFCRTTYDVLMCRLSGLPIFGRLSAPVDNHSG